MNTQQINDNTPIYLKIYETLKARISDGTYPVGSIIPGENVLSNEFDVSRVTIRSALRKLEIKGFIVRKPGFGTIVKVSEQSLLRFTLIKSMTTEMKEIGQPSNTIYSVLELVKANQKLSYIFNIPIGKNLYILKRIRGKQEEPIVYSISYLNLDIILPNNDDFLYGSLYNFLVKNNVVFSHIKEIVEAELASEEVAKLLKIPKKSAVLKRTRFSYNSENRLVEYTLNYYNPAVYKYTVEVKSDSLKFSGV